MRSILESVCVKFTKEFLAKLNHSLMVGSTCPDEYEFTLTIKIKASEIRELEKVFTDAKEK